MGNGQGSTALPWQELRVFSIENGRLDEPAIFPPNDSHLNVVFDTHAFKEYEKIPVIKIRDNGKLILFPVPTLKEGFSGKYRHYLFNGRKYNIR